MPRSPYVKKCHIELTVLVVERRTMTPPLHTLRIRLPADHEQRADVPDGTICLLLFAVAGLTALACWLGHVGGMPPATWWMLFA